MSEQLVANKSVTLFFGRFNWYYGWLFLKKLSKLFEDCINFLLSDLTVLMENFVLAQYKNVLLIFVDSSSDHLLLCAQQW